MADAAQSQPAEKPAGSPEATLPKLSMADFRVYNRMADPMEIFVRPSRRSPVSTTHARFQPL